MSEQIELSSEEEELNEEIKLFKEQYRAAPSYQYKSRNTGQKVQSKYGIKMDFIDHLQELQILFTCPKA